METVTSEAEAGDRLDATMPFPLRGRSCDLSHDRSHDRNMSARRGRYI